MRVLIIEDEPIAAKRLKRLIENVAPQMEVQAIVDTITAAVDYFSSNAMPDLVFSDIQLADGLSFQVFEQVAVTCPVIFTTAYDQYALKAFEANGIAYLLKPIDEEKLRNSIEKLDQFKPKVTLQDVLALTQAHLGTAEYKTRFLIKVGEKLKSISTQNIKAFYSMEKATYLLNDEGRNYTLDYSLEQLSGMVDPKQFFRINRKQLVAIDAIDHIVAYSNSRLKLNVSDMEEELIVAREKVSAFKQWLDK